MAAKPAARKAATRGPGSAKPASPKPTARKPAVRHKKKKYEAKAAAKAAAVAAATERERRTAAERERFLQLARSGRARAPWLAADLRPAPDDPFPGAWSVMSLTIFFFVALTTTVKLDNMVPLFFYLSSVVAYKLHSVVPLIFFFSLTVALMLDSVGADLAAFVIVWLLVGWVGWYAGRGAGAYPELRAPRPPRRPAWPHVVDIPPVPSLLTPLVFCISCAVAHKLDLDVMRIVSLVSLAGLLLVIYLNGRR